MKEMGLCPIDVEPHAVIADETKTWEEMSPEEKAKSSKAMEVFAAMVESRSCQQKCLLHDEIYAATAEMSHALKLFPRPRFSNELS